MWPVTGANALIKLQVGRAGEVVGSQVAVMPLIDAAHEATAISGIHVEPFRLTLIVLLLAIGYYGSV